MQAAGWIVEQAVAPEIARVNEVFAQLLATDLEVIRRQLEPLLSDALSGHLLRLCRWAKPEQSSNLRLHAERSRLTRAWSAFFSEYPIVIGPNWGRAIWPVDADLDPASGMALLAEMRRFITPGNVLGLPSLALPELAPPAPRGPCGSRRGVTQAFCRISAFVRTEKRTATPGRARSRPSRR